MRLLVSLLPLLLHAQTVEPEAVFALSGIEFPAKIRGVDLRDDRLLVCYEQNRKPWCAAYSVQGEPLWRHEMPAIFHEARWLDRDRFVGVTPMAMGGPRLYWQSAEGGTVGATTVEACYPSLAASGGGAVTFSDGIVVRYSGPDASAEMLPLARMLDANPVSLLPSPEGGFAIVDHRTGDVRVFNARGAPEVGFVAHSPALSRLMAMKGDEAGLITQTAGGTDGTLWLLVGEIRAWEGAVLVRATLTGAEPREIRLAPVPYKPPFDVRAIQFPRSEKTREWLMPMLLAAEGTRIVVIDPFYLAAASYRVR